MAKRYYPKNRLPHNATLAQKFARYTKRDVNGCLVWTGARNSSGYGNVRHGGQWLGAHVAAWMEVNGQVPAGLNILHKCDNRPCCNVDHLFLGTDDDNSKDMVAKGRSCIGTRHGRAVLTEKDVLAIRSAPKVYGSGRVLAKQYGVTPAMISLIRNNLNWRHI